MTSSCMNAPRIMVFRPTLEEMKDFPGYIAYMESKGAHLAGIAKVIPPKEFVPRKSSYDDIEMVIPAPIQQEVMGHQGLYTQYNIQKKAMTVTEYRKLANSSKYATPPHFDYEDLERKYWKNITYNQPIYGADISGSIIDKDWTIWNINRLNTILDLIEEEEGVKIEGVNTAYLYFGMWKTTFAWHTEDMDLYSINYIHYGAPKTWYSIPTEHARRLERLAAGFFPGSFSECPNFLRHKMTLIAPYILKKYSIPYNKITHEVGEFMITFPYGYHAGFNHGYNIAESTNFASPRWINFGKRASSCVCSKDSVKIGMDPFVRVFQPDRFQAWTEGRDVIYLPEIEGPNAPTVTHKQLPKSPEKDIKGKAVHRRHPVHKKGIIGDVKEKDKSHHHHSESKSTSHEEKKLRKKRKKEKKRKLAKKKSEEEMVVCKQEETVNVSATAPAIDIQPNCGLEQLVQAAQKIGELPNGRTMQEGMVHVKSEVGTGTESVPMDNAKVTSNGESSRTDNGSSVRGEHTYSMGSTDSIRRKRGRPRKSSNDGDSNPMVLLQPLVPKTELDDEPDIKKEPTESMEDEEPTTDKLTTKDDRQTSVRGLSLIPTRTNPDGSTARSSIKKGFSKPEMAKMKYWARSMNGLWIIQPAQFISEQVHNISMADQIPGCCVCALFCNERMEIINSEYDDLLSGPSPAKQLQDPSPDKRLRVLIPEMCFSHSTDGALRDGDGRSKILNCNCCKISVHSTCYGEDCSLEVDNWNCDRCKKEDWQAICCLCNLRGGALKATTTGQWAHIVCAIAIPEVSFHNVKLRAPIDVTNISPARLKLKCHYCRSFIKCSHKYGACIQCSAGKCALSFHVTCALAVGVVMEPNDWPCHVYTTCLRHPPLLNSRYEPRKDIIRDVFTDDKVIAKHKNGRFYEAEVLCEKEQMFCHVNFNDNSFSENLFPEDIESHNLSLNGPPKEGERVKVRWTDGVLYNGCYVKNSFIKIYDVEFADGSILTVKREDIYVNGETLPKKVKSRLSTASDMRHGDFHENRVIGEKYRHVSSRYASQSEQGVSDETTTSVTASSSSSVKVEVKMEQEDEELIVVVV